MYSPPAKRLATQAMRRDILESILNKPVPEGHTVESSTTVITNHGTLIINIYGPTDPSKPPLPPEVSTIDPTDQG